MVVKRYIAQTAHIAIVVMATDVVSALLSQSSTLRTIVLQLIKRSFYRC